MPELDEVQRTAAAVRARRDAADARLRELVLRLQSVEAALAEARREAPARGQSERLIDLERERDELQHGLDDARRNRAETRERAVGLLGEMIADPRAFVGQLADAVPFLLFPVRIETKFARSGGRDELRVRIFPDDIAVAHHEKELTATEKDAGETYWRTRASANALADAGERERVVQGAWNLLATRYGAYRASWIARATTPTNWGPLVVDPASLAFPALTVKPLAWTDTPRSPVLPDRFAVILERGAASRTVFGRAIPDDLPLGPDPLQSDTFLTRNPTTGRLEMSDELRWLIDFDQAEAVGMALRIPLSTEEAAGGFDRVLVLGVRVSSGAAAGPGLLAGLIESHRYSHGVGLVPQGTPTNNTDEAAAGLSTASESVEETYALEHDTTPFPLASEPMRQNDGQRLAEALDLGHDLVRALPNARRTDVAESVAMHRALWSATLGHFAAEMLEGAFTDADVSATRLFVTEFVHGRGTLPVLRVGTEPYGIVVTSSFDDWQWSDVERGTEGDFWDRLQTQLGLLREHWTREVKDSVRFVGKRDATGQLLDPFETLVNVIGLQASSVEFGSRTGVPDSYLTALTAYAGNDPVLVNNWIANAKNSRILELKDSHLPSSPKGKIGGVLFLESLDPVGGPLVDGDPAVPLSETQAIRPYDPPLGHNYIDWLVTASGQDLQHERFVGADGKVVAPPAALLYKMLRVAVVAELASGSRFFSERIRPDLFVDAPKPDVTANIGAQVLMPAHYTLLDTARIGVTTESASTGDYLLGHARAATPLVQKPPEAAALASMTDALRLLAPLPTARLERLFAEHVDVCSYRLDAWLAGLFARRLRIARARRAGAGLYLGAFGWVEDLRPDTAARQTVPPAEIPPELQPAVEGPVVTYTDNGGFVHAPSLPHAVTAAVLRNAYLTHTEPGRAERMSVNLSSARVRTAIAYVEGLQNGQELGALLGYQLERGLHERHPGVELDRFIYVLRERFPLISKKLTPTPDGVPAEAVEARNVVNGYDLLDFVRGKTYPYGLALPAKASPDPATARQADAIEAEILELANALDAVADLLLSESVHQVVQGNYARARGAVQSLTEGEVPPLPDVVQTPRSGRALTHRVAVMLDPAATAGWAAPLTPRAIANAPLNHWLAALLPPPADVQWQLRLGGGAPQVLALPSLGLEPIDVVLMSGERLGDLSSELERWLVFQARTSLAVADDVATFFFTKTDPGIPDAKALVIDPDRAPAGKHSLGSLLPLLKALRTLITAGRPLQARDLMRPTEAQSAHPENPGGYDGAAFPLKDLAELKARVDAAHAALTAEASALATLVATMKPLVDALDGDPALAVQAAWGTLVPALRGRLGAILRFGVPEAMPSTGVTLDRPLVTAAFAQARAVGAIVDRRLGDAATRLGITFTAPLPTDPGEAARETGRRVTARLDAYTEAARLLLGSHYVVIPSFAAHVEGRPELAAAIASPVESDPLKIESWLQPLGRVRTAMQALGTVADYHGWLHDSLLALRPVQLPVAAGAGWIGGAFGATVTADDVVSVVMLGAPASVSTPLAGLLVDEWTEVVPTRRETTGIAMHVNRPNAVAPQALLLAVAPKQTGQWAWSDLVAILRDTLARAKLRAVEPEHIGYPYFQLLPPIVTAFNRTWLIPAAKFSVKDLLASGGA